MTYFLTNKKRNDNIFDNIQGLFTDCISKQARCDIEETQNQYILSMEIPGVDKKDIDISVYDSTLTILINKNKGNVERENANYLVRERSNMDVKRSFYLEDLDEDNITATLENGILVLVIEKVKCECKAKKPITIN